MLSKSQALSLAILALSASHSTVRAQTWTGLGTNNLWNNIVNWDTAVPVSGNTANFNDTGTNTSISLGNGARPIGNIAFDSLNTNTYNLGVLASGDQFDVDSGGSISTGAGATTLQTVNAKVNGLGGLSLTNSGSGGLTFADSVTSNGALSVSSTSTGPVTISGNVTPTASTVSLSTSLAGSAVTVGGGISNTIGLTIAATAGKVNLNGSAAIDGVVAVSGAGTVAVNAPIANGTSSSASLADTMTTGTLVLNAASTYSGGTSILLSGSSALHSIRIGNDAAFGTGPITPAGTVPALYYAIGADRTIANDIGSAGTPASQGMFWETASAAVDPTGPHSLTFTGNIYLTGGRTFTNNLNGGTLTLGSAATPGTITRNNTLTFQSQAQVQPNGGVMVLNDVVAASTAGNNSVTFQNGLKVTINNTILGNGNIVVQSTAAPNTVAHFNKTDMYTGTGNVNLFNNNATATTGTTVYFDQPNVFGSTLSAFPTTSIVNPTGLGTTVYVNSPLITNHRWDIEGDAVVYFNAPTTFNGTATSAFQVQGTNTRQQTAMVINSTLTKGPNAGSAVRIATGTLAGNGGTILSNVSILHSTNAVTGSYLAPGTPALPGGTNMTPSYQNGPGQLTITFATGNALDFNGTSNCANCNFYAEIGGTTPGTQYDQVVVNGTAAIGTTANKRAHLKVATINNFSIHPAADATFELIKATTLSPGSGAGLGFIDVTLPDPANWSVQYGTLIANSLTVTVTGTGDFNGDHVVDAADYVSWRKTDGTAGGYDAFRRNFGNTVPGGGSSLSSTAVPEPGALLLACLATAGVCTVRRRSSRA